MMRWIKNIFVLGAGCMLFAGNVLATREGMVSSLEGRTSFGVARDCGRMAFRVAYDGRPAATVSTGKDWRSFTARGNVRIHRGTWKTVWGDRAEVNDAYAEQAYDAVDAKGRAVIVEARAYDEGFAFRCRLPEGGAFYEQTSVDYPDEAVAWAIEKTENPYPAIPVPVQASAKKGMQWMTPLTVRAGGVFASFFDAFAVGYPRIRVVPHAGGVDVKVLQKEIPVLPQNGAMPWRVLQLGTTPGELIDHSTLILNLNPPCVLAETAWIRPGLTLSNLSNCKLNNAELLAAAQADIATGAKYLQLDWGWYGTEWAWSDADRATFLKTNPQMADESTWRANTYGNARKTATGIVPYLPGWQRQFPVDLDFPALIPELKKLGVDLSLYVRGNVLEKEKLDELFALYEKWGVAGVKPGFVQYGDASATDWNRRVVACAAKHHLWVDIHDANVPDGLQRTYPNLFLMEGVGGEEGKHPVHQDVSIPFARGLVGPFDYTPMVFMAGRSHAHVLAMLLCYPGPTAVMRGNSVARAVCDAETSSFGWGPERAFVKALPWTWDESKTLDAEIGRRLVTARRSGMRWFLAGMSADDAETIDLPLSFLEKGRTYMLTLWRDNCDDNQATCRRCLMEQQVVEAHDQLRLTMAAAGGFLALIEPDRSAEAASYCAWRARQPQEVQDIVRERDARHFIAANEGKAPAFHLTGWDGATIRTTEQTTETVVLFTNVGEVMFRLNGTLYGAQVPDASKTCVWRHVPLKNGTNELECRAGPFTLRYVLNRVDSQTVFSGERGR